MGLLRFFPSEDAVSLHISAFLVDAVRFLSLSIKIYTKKKIHKIKTVNTFT